MLPMKTVIVDDEPLARRGLKIRLQQFGEIDIVGECANGREALQFCAEHSPDVVFLDIQMPGLDGFDVVKGLPSDDMPIIIFVTAFDHYAVEAFNVHAVDYVLKPAEDDRLAEAVGKAKARLEEKDALAEKQRLLGLINEIRGQHPGDVKENNIDKSSDTLFIKDGLEVTAVKTADIDWVDAAGDYMCIHVGVQTHIMRSTMKELESRLPENMFQRVHRSTLVNFDRIKKVFTHHNGDYCLMLNCGTKLKIGRSFKDKIKQLVNNR